MTNPRISDLRESTVLTTSNRNLLRMYHVSQFYICFALTVLPFLGMSADFCIDKVIPNSNITSCPDSSFTVVQDEICGSEGIQFALTPQTDVTYFWNFGDGSTSTQSQPTHIYALDGGGTQDITVTLTVTQDAANGGCSTTSSQTITVLQNPNPGIDDLAPLCLNNPDWPNYELIASPQPFGNTGIANWDVDWGNGESTSFASYSVFNPPTTAYDNYGYYTITVDLLGNNGCTTQVVDSVFVGNNPNIGSANPGNTDGLCSPYLLEFPITNYESNGEGTTYILDFGDGSTETLLDSDLNPVPPTTVSHEYVLSSCGEVTPEGSQNAFRFRIEAVNECGTSVTTVDPIRIHLGPDSQIEGPDELCMGQAFGYSISGAGQIVTDAECNPTDTYWEITPLNGQAGVTPNQGVGTSFNATFPAPGEYQISAIDIHPNCPNGDDEMIVCVYPTLQAVGQVAPLNGCAPLTVDLQDLSNNPAICGDPNTTWIISGGPYNYVSGGPNDVAPVVDLTAAGTYTITLRVAIPDKDACPPDEQTFTIEVLDPLSVSPIDCEIPGCMNPSACNYDEAATLDDGSCLLPFQLGWCNCEGDVFDALGNCGGDCPQDIDGDGVCDGLGCMDAEACNYSSIAILNDGSCQYGCIYCDEGTFWNQETETCQPDPACTFDGNDDGSIGIQDLLAMLQLFGQPCGN